MNLMTLRQSGNADLLLIADDWSIDLILHHCWQTAGGNTAPGSSCKHVPTAKQHMPKFDINSWR